jgi:hypothetical protein
MATPRVFISSTFYDLRQIRADLEFFIREMGYEPVLHERGGVPYGSSEKLEEYAYKEVDLADLLVSIVGSRFGSQSQHENRSISQEELKRALDNDVQVYIFVEHAVLTEFETYKVNKALEGIEWRFVDDVRVYEYLEGIFALTNNNVVQGFETAADITTFLKRQWAGLFHRFLQDQAKFREINALDEMQATVATLDRIVQFLTAERSDQAEALADILSANHPLFARLRSLLKVRYPLFFRNINELHRWLVDAQAFQSLDKEIWDDDEHREWYRPAQYLKIKLSIFDDEGRLRPIPQEDWDDEWVTLNKLPEPPDDVVVFEEPPDLDEPATQRTTSRSRARQTRRRPSGTE